MQSVRRNRLRRLIRRYLQVGQFLYLAAQQKPLSMVIAALQDFSW
jgi:RNase P protein component